MVPEIEKRRLYRGRGGQVIREAVSVFIKNMALAAIPLPKFSEYARAHGPKPLKMRTIFKSVNTSPPSSTSPDACPAF